VKPFTARNLPPKDLDLDQINADRAGSPHDGYGWIPFAVVAAALLAIAVVGMLR
jgi:hypothetical protein